MNKIKSFTSESVTNGHPDKICDIISDAILDACLVQDPYSRVACECSVTTDYVLVFGEITTNANVDYRQVVRDTIRGIGYTSNDIGFNYKSCQIDVKIKKQSNDIAIGVNKDTNKSIGAGDQGLMFGYACNETESLMPLPIMLAHSLTYGLNKLRTDGVLPYLRPDGKSQVTVKYENDIPKSVEKIVVSAQHDETVTLSKLRYDIINNLILNIIPEHYLTDETEILINPTGRFVIGGPNCDAGLTGRKIIVDTYGGYARHGGGAFSGKDCTKVDRSASYMARYIAKNIVASGLATKCEIQLSYAIGVSEPTSLYVDTFDVGIIDDSDIETIVREVFPLTPGGIIEHLDLNKPIYKETASYGHFGLFSDDKPWEQLDSVNKILKAYDDILINM